MRLVLPFAVAVFLLGFSMLYDGLASKDAVVDRSVGYAEGCDEGTVKGCSPARTLQLRAAYLGGIQLPVREFQVGEGFLLASVLGPLLSRVPSGVRRPSLGLPVLAGLGLVTFIFCAVLDLHYATLRGQFVLNPLEPLLAVFPPKTLGAFGFGGLGLAVLALWRAVGLKNALLSGTGAASVFLLALALFDPSELPSHATNFVPWAYEGIDLFSNQTALIAAPALAGALFFGGRR